MRILHILDHSAPLHSGYTFRTLAILQQQRALGWDTRHLTSAKQESGALLEQECDGWHFSRTPPEPGLWARLPVLGQLSIIRGLAQRLYQVAQKTRPDILQAHSPCLNALAALRVGRALGIPVAYEVRAFWEDAASDHGTSRQGGLRYHATRALETHALRRVDAVTTICEGLRLDICARGIPLGKVTVIPNAVDLDRFHMNQFMHQARWHQAAGTALDASLAVAAKPECSLLKALHLTDQTVLGFIGSFYAYEGLAQLLAALPQLLASNPKLHLLLVGGGPQEEELKMLASRLGVAGKVTFTGRVPHQTIDRYYDLIDVLVYPRLPMRLTDLVTPLKPLEAMAQGKLVLASNVGGHRELIEDGKTGHLFQAGNVQALAHSVNQLLRSRNSWPALRLAARQFVENERNWRASVSRYGAIYQRLLAGNAA